MNLDPKNLHLHLVSDSTGETLHAMARAVITHYPDIVPIEHLYSLVRTKKHLERVVEGIKKNRGAVLFTIIKQDIRSFLEQACRSLDVPFFSLLDPVTNFFSEVLNAEAKPLIGAQHAMNTQYFKRIEALNFTMMHDDGQVTDGFSDADIILLGISRSSKTPTSIYLANRGYKTANVPIVPGIPLPGALFEVSGPLIVGLVASVERIAQIRKSRLLSMREEKETSYVDRTLIQQELISMRRLCEKHKWPVLDVTRRSIEETAAEIINLKSEALRRDHKDT